MTFMTETIAKVIDYIIAKIRRTGCYGGITSSLMNKKIVVNRYPATAGPCNKAIIVGPFGMTFCR